jgi:collagenase-like PrtC family protease
MEWNGGRVTINGHPSSASREEVQEYFSWIKSQGFGGITLVFTASSINLSNPLGNILLEELARVQEEGVFEGEVTTRSLNLVEYIHTRFPGLSVKSSILLATQEQPTYRGAKYYNDLLKVYNKVVLHPDDNRDLELLLGIEEIENIEVLINENCPKGCRARNEHYNKVDMWAKTMEGTPENEIAIRDYNSFFDKYCPKYQTKGKDMGYLRESVKLIESLHTIGVRNWKLEGRDNRTSPASLWESVKLYLIKDPDLLRELKF